jgi:hypothetical protein
MIPFLIFSIPLLVFGYWLSPLWFIMLFVWVSMTVFIKMKRYNVELSLYERNAFEYTIYLYPLIETILKFMIVKDIIPYSWFILNRIEHFSWAFVMGILILPLLKNKLKTKDIVLQGLVFIGLVIIIGNINEFFEYFIRIFIIKPDDYYRISLYYSDTIIDLIVNVFGAIAGYCFILFLNKKSLLKQYIRK